MRGVRALLPPRLEQATSAAALQELVQEALCGTPRQEAGAACAQDRKVKPWIRQLETQQLLPVHARTDRRRRLTIGQVFAARHARDQREAPRREAGLAMQGEKGGKVVVLQDGPEGITEGAIRMALGQGRTGDTSGFFRHRRDDVGGERPHNILLLLEGRLQRSRQSSDARLGIPGAPRGSESIPITYFLLQK